MFGIAGGIFYKCIFSVIGSQWRPLQTEVMYSCFGVCITGGYVNALLHCTFSDHNFSQLMVLQEDL